MPHESFWANYIEHKYGIALRSSEGDLDLESLHVTQGEIELIKYEMVLREGFRIHEPIVVYRGRLGQAFIVDGHTRARVKWDRHEPGIRACLLSSHEPDVDEEVLRMAQTAGEGQLHHIWDIPIRDRLGRGSEAWNRRRLELLEKLHKPPTP